MKTLKTLALASAVSVALLGAGGVLAASDGTEGTSSKGDFGIEFVKKGEIIITNLEDLTLPDGANSDGDLIAWNDRVCVGTTTATDYSITATGAGTSFTLSGGDKTADYSVHYADGVASPGSVVLDSGNELTHGVAKSGFSPSTVTLCNADSTYTSTVWVKLAKANIPDDDGEYSDVVTLTVTPE